ncbi:hypothetical protein C8Q70DRAFT_1053848 [Cubamyces menziesii]|nr:hypothetical protein C8Q70DRAFT_1053848 [Cubamyces menziesii]
MDVTFVRIAGLAESHQGDPFVVVLPRSKGTIPGTLEPPYEHPHLGIIYNPGERERILSRLSAWQTNGTCGITLSIKVPPIHLSEKSTTRVMEEGEEEEKERSVYGAWVYEVAEAEIIHTDGSSEALPRRLPPLVLKVAPRNMGRNLAREGCVYGLVEDLQGRIFPHCYGYFTRKINLQETTILPWGPLSEDLSGSTANLQVLLLEKVGKSISCMDLRLLDGVRNELLLMIKEMTHLGVYCSNIKVTDIVQANCGEESPESRGAEVTEGVYTVRFIDLEYLVYGAWVYEVAEAEVISEGPSSEEPPSRLPPLILKVAPRSRRRNLTREGCTYGLVEDLQGRIFPRCYGYFTCKINLQEVAILPWGALPKGRPASTVKLEVLSLERAGESIAKMDLNALDGVRGELKEMVKEMGAFGAHYSDVKIKNIVQAYSKEGSSESHSANVTNESHTMRFIDLEYAGFPRKERAIY